MTNTKEEMLELNETSKLIAEFLSKSQLDYSFNMYSEGNYGLEHIYTIEAELIKNFNKRKCAKDIKLNIVANTEGRISFEVFDK